MPDVVLPVLDEREALPWVLGRMPAGYTPIVVDNGSRDGSGELAAKHGARGDVRVAEVALDPLRGGIEVARALAVRRGQQRVDHAHGMPGGQQRVDDVRADEPGAAGDEDGRFHGRGSVRARGRNRGVASAA